MFREWLERRKLREGLGDSGVEVDTNKLGLSDTSDFAEDHDRLQTKLFKTIMSKYPDETMQFLNGIAQRGDEEVASLLSKLRREKKPMFNEPKHQSDGDEVVPANADTGQNNEFGQD